MATSQTRHALKRHSRHQGDGPLVFVIMDGVGVGLGDGYDAVARARTPSLDRLKDVGLYRTLRAHGVCVGLPSDADMGNSEVGHNILGAGRIFDQGAKCVNSAVDSGAIWGDSWRELTDAVAADNGTLHLIGLVSDGNVHSSMGHLERLINRAGEDGITSVRVHALLDGRDVPDHSAELYIETLERILGAARERFGGCFAIASGGGRMGTTMDRYEADWRIVERGWRAHVLGDARRFSTAAAAVATFRLESPGISDQNLPAFVVEDGDGPVGTIEDGDGVVIFNFRGDRVVQISQAFTAGNDFAPFARERIPRVAFAGMVQYDGDLNLPERYLVSPGTVDGTISECLAASGVGQFACAETQKYGHVTFFWNGNRSGKFSAERETYLEVPSDTVPFEQRPWMKSAETADAVIAAIESGDYGFIRTNLAGGDMVGHTGDFRAARLAVEAVDLAVGRIAAAVAKHGGVLVVSADHGNADDMVERDGAGSAKLNDAGSPRWRTAHSLNPVPFYVVPSSHSPDWSLAPGLEQAGLANVAGTLITLLGYEPPHDYEPSLVVVK
jgi:2,3-bisphosphoglycerate-independent phosphoglycerate mutase